MDRNAFPVRIRLPPDIFPNPVEILPATKVELNDPAVPLIKEVDSTLPADKFPVVDTLPATTLPVAVRDAVLVTPPTDRLDVVEIFPTARLDDKVAFVPSSAFTAITFPALTLPVPVDNDPAVTTPDNVADTAVKFPVAAKLPTCALALVDKLPHDMFPVATTDTVLTDWVAIRLPP